MPDLYDYSSYLFPEQIPRPRISRKGMKRIDILDTPVTSNCKKSN